MMQKEEIKIVIGAGGYNNNPGWIHTQEEEVDLLDGETWKEKFVPNSITAILAEHVWEHLTYDEGVQAAKICRQFLKENGYVRCAVPDGYFQNDEYQNIVKVGGPGPIDHPAASHKIVHNYHTLSKMFEEAGYEVELIEFCDESGKFHFRDWDGKDGVIFRSKQFDPRNQREITCPSVIVDAWKR